MAAIVTAAELADWLGRADPFTETQTVAAETLLAGTQAQMEGWLGRPLGLARVTERGVWDGQLLRLTRTPVDTVHTVTVDGTAVTDGWEVRGGGGVWFTGIPVWHLSLTGAPVAEVDYTGGLSGTALDAAKLALLKIVSRDALPASASSETSGTSGGRPVRRLSQEGYMVEWEPSWGAPLTLYGDNQMVDPVLETLRPWRRVRAW